MFAGSEKFSPSANLPNLPPLLPPCPCLAQDTFRYNFTNSFSSLCFHALGTGTLGVPFAVMQGGYMSLVAIVIISIITNYTGKLIIECLYEKPFNDQGTRGVRLRNSYALIGKLV